jgi:hypothetical protein
MSEPAAATIDRFLVENAKHITVVARGKASWDVSVPSYWREAIAVSLNLSDAHLRCDAFFLRAPDEKPGASYALLLRKNARAHVWKFTVNDVGDVSLVCELPCTAIDLEELDTLFGALITLVDDTYVPYMKMAFGTALEKQVRSGGPGLDAPPWAGEWTNVERTAD